MSNTESVSHNNKRIAKNTILLYVRMIVVMLVTLYTTRVVLNVLGVVDYGIYNIVSGFVAMFSFLNTSMAQGTQRFYNYEGAKDSDNLIKVFNTSVQIQAILSIVIFVLLESFGIWYMNNKIVVPAERLLAAKYIFQFTTVSLILVIMQIPFSAAVIAHEKMDLYAFLSIFDAVMKLIIAIVLPYIGGDKLIVYGALFLLISFINIIVYYLYSRINFSEIQFKRVFDMGLFKKMLSFSTWNVLDTFASMIRGQGLNLLLNGFFGPVVNAARGVSVHVSGALRSFSMTILSASRPQLIRAYAVGNFTRVKNLLYSICKASFILLYVLMVPIVLELSYVINLWLNNVVPDYTIPFSLLSMVDALLGIMIVPLVQIFQASGNIRKIQLTRSLVIIMILPVSWVALALGASPIAVYWITVIDAVLNYLVTLYLLKKELKFNMDNYFNEVLFKSLIIVIFVPVLPYIVHHFMSASFMRFVLVCLSSLVSIIILTPFVFNKAETNLLLSFAKGGTSKLKKTR